jgi:hypothetical protein
MTTAECTMLVLTFCLVIAAFIQAVIYAGQAWLMFRTLEENRKSTQIALRAYVCLTFDEQNPPKPKWVENKLYCEFLVKNTGQTPARNVIAQCKTIRRQFPQQPDFPDFIIDPNKGSGFATLSPQEPMKLPCAPDDTFNQIPVQIPGEDMPEIVWYIFGRIEYTDVFDEKRNTCFCYAFKHGVLFVTPQGNEMDKRT